MMDGSRSVVLQPNSVGENFQFFDSKLKREAFPDKYKRYSLIIQYGFKKFKISKDDLLDYLSDEAAESLEKRLKPGVKLLFNISEPPKTHIWELGTEEPTEETVPVIEFKSFSLVLAKEYRSTIGEQVFSDFIKLFAGDKIRLVTRNIFDAFLLAHSFGIKEEHLYVIRKKLIEESGRKDIAEAGKVGVLSFYKVYQLLFEIYDRHSEHWKQFLRAGLSNESIKNYMNQASTFKSKPTQGYFGMSSLTEDAYEDLITNICELNKTNPGLFDVSGALKLINRFFGEEKDRKNTDTSFSEDEKRVNSRKQDIVIKLAEKYGIVINEILSKQLDPDSDPRIIYHLIKTIQKSITHSWNELEESQGMLYETLYTQSY
eukprot:TRINITY_DN5698_c0_g2_i1.p1 TRINITY_DN5698_c0_g2~~TRINITY_DN5698_c0_g2_i1.p1  ORF type:complete len:373 (-),score=73.84 TRINITY_DN5698_c0_g2_i1:26-1144(-)